MSLVPLTKRRRGWSSKVVGRKTISIAWSLIEILDARVVA
jgi:hypothetical protein